MQVTEYDPKTGAILGLWTIDESMIDAWGKPYITGNFPPQSFYVDVGRKPPIIQKRPPQGTKQNKKSIIADGIDTVKLSGLPVPCVVEIAGEWLDVDDGVFEWGTHLAGEYGIRVEAFPFLDWEGEITAE